MSVEVGTGKRTDIQGLRALAVLLVVLYHGAGVLPGGFVGVDVFFVISGFVISRMLLGELAASGTLDLRRFYLRRARRLLPALALTTTVVAVLAIVANPIGTQDVAAYTGAAASLFTANAHLYRSAPGYFAAASEYNPFLHTWSLAVEEQFYLVFPGLLLLAWWAAARWLPERRRRAGLAGFVFLVAAGSFALACTMSYAASWHIEHLKAPRTFAFYASPTRGWEFAVGILLAIYDGHWRRLPAALLRALAVAGLALVGVGAVLLDRRTPFPGVAALLPVVGTALLIVSGAGAPHATTRLLSTPVAVWIGDRSYGWYLWHWPFIVFARALLPWVAWAPALGAALSLLPTWASYRFVENPIRFDARATPWRTLRLSAASVAVPIAACLLLLGVSSALQTWPPARPVSDALLLHADEVRGCEGAQAFDSPDCTWNGAATGGQVLLVGDSNAGQFTEPVSAAAGALGRPILVATMPACPFVDLEVAYNGFVSTPCQQYVRRALEVIAARRPALVVIGTAADGYIEETNAAFRPAGQAAFDRTPEGKARDWGAGMQRTLTTIAKSSRVLLIHPVPRFPGWTLGACAAVLAVADPKACGPGGPSGRARAEVEAWRQRAMASERGAVASVVGASELDVEDLLCPGNRCPVEVDGHWLYRDGSHLSVEGARSLTGALQGAMAAQLGGAP